MDNGSWFHIVFQWDSNNGTTADRFIIWINGVRQDLIQYNATQSGSSSGFMTGETWIGRAADTTGYNAEFYLAELHAVNNAVLAPTHFGFTDPITGVWRPKRSSDIVAATTYGTGGWYLDFSDPSNLGADRSGNGNNWTANNFDAADSVFDSPTNNFCVLDNNDFAGNKATDGNLQSGTAGTSNWRHTRSTFVLEEGSGRWYWEVQQKGTIDGSNGWIAGLAHQNFVARTVDPNSNSAHMYARQSDTRYWNGGNTASHFPTTTNNDIIQFAFDADRGYLWSGKNNTWTGANPATGTNSSWPNVAGDVTPFVGSYGSNNYSIVNFGQQAFTYTPPTGFRSICSKNFAIQGPTVVSPKSHFDVVTYTGNGAASGHQITGLEFQPDFVWIKGTKLSGYYHVLNDSVRGAGRNLFTNETKAENGGSEYSVGDLLSSFDKNGFTVNANVNASTNGSSQDYVAWTWKAGGGGGKYNIDGVPYLNFADTGLTAGDIEPIGMSVNTKAGFSIISYTIGDSSTPDNFLIPHGLNKTPEMIVVKCWDQPGHAGSQMWCTYHHSSPTETGYLNKSDNFISNSYSINWHGTQPGNTCFTVGTSTGNNNSGDTCRQNNSYVAYCWHSVPGYSAFGSYAAGETFVYTGFKPAFLMVKQITGSTNAYSSWTMIDNARDQSNVSNTPLYANDSKAEALRAGDTGAIGNNADIDLLSNGFKVYNRSSGETSAPGTTYIYMVFAETPLNFANAR